MIEVNANNVLLNGFTVDGDDIAVRAIRVNGKDGVVVENNIITGAVRAAQYNGDTAGNTGGIVRNNLIQVCRPVARATEC